MVTEEMVEKAMLAHGKKRTNEIQMRAALEAVAPMIRNATIEEAAKVADRFIEPPAKSQIAKGKVVTAYQIGVAIRALATPSIKMEEQE